ncbi:nucleotidyl transferase AbiEii/AbiGii toxin family protein [Spirosoma profusum]|uniref:nucleotidyl transferase AbiEii/AbiGii toxin family protein n=1 Tax=Spirosoma profusum TaxID=2771354 RepID=UPI001CC2233D|nr:nucleotidyl transferase AbiEii/AbiGii toxin family protein [Spirosoma profusum]
MGSLGPTAHFTSTIAEFAIFKGGTALSKCFSFINHFSEDIDLMLVRKPYLSAKQLKERLKGISHVVLKFSLKSR